MKREINLEQLPTKLDSLLSAINRLDRASAGEFPLPVENAV